MHRSTSIPSRLGEQNPCSLFYSKTVFSRAPIWQVWHGNDSRLKTLGPSALFIPLRANMYNYKSKCAEGNHVNTNKGFLVAKLISCK